MEEVLKSIFEDRVSDEEIKDLADKCRRSQEELKRQLHARVRDNVQEIIDTISTLEDYPAQYDGEYSKEVYLDMIKGILPLLLSEAPASQIAQRLAEKCPKFGS